MVESPAYAFRMGDVVLQINDYDKQQIFYCHEAYFFLASRTLSDLHFIWSHGLYLVQLIKLPQI